MARPIWTGTLSFGLLNVPVSLMSGERRVDLQFRMLDARDKAAVRYERVNAETGEEVPWKEVVKAFEYDKGSYVVLEEEDLKAAAAQSHSIVEIQTFVPADAIAPPYFEKPYVLVPSKKAEKGYVLLRETLRASKRIGVARVTIRTREYLAAVIPQDDALMLILLRYAQEVIDPADYGLPTGKTSDYRINAKELEMAQQLVESMTGDWNPGEYEDDFRSRLQDIIRKKMKAKGATARVADADDELPEDAATNVVDFMSLLQKSIAGNRRTPAAKKAPAKSAATKKAPAKSAATKKASGKSAAKRKPATKSAAKKAAPRKRKAG